MYILVCYALERGHTYKCGQQDKLKDGKHWKKVREEEGI
jgi:hypothetical protein